MCLDVYLSSPSCSGENNPASFVDPGVLVDSVEWVILVQNDPGVVVVGDDAGVVDEPRCGSGIRRPVVVRDEW